MKLYSGRRNKVTLYAGKWEELEVILVLEKDGLRKINMTHIFSHLWNLDFRRRKNTKVEGRYLGGEREPVIVGRGRKVRNNERGT